MFRLEFLKLKDHPQLGDINLNLSDVEELTNIEKPIYFCDYWGQWNREEFYS